MRSECQFFMAPEDEAEFLSFAKEKFDLSMKDQWLTSPTCPLGGIQVLRSGKYGNELTAGRIAVATHYGSEKRFPNQAAEIEKTYSVLRRYVQRNFSNKLLMCADGEKSGRAIRMLWLGPFAHAWLAATPGALLRQGRGFRSNFVPEVCGNADA